MSGVCGSCGQPLPATARPRVRRPEDVYAQLPKAELSDGQECFFALYLDSRCGMIEARLLSKGTADHCVAHPREVFKGAVRVGACKVVIAHNHPSGVLEPSPEDIALTERIREAGRVLGIPLVDHVIVGPTGNAVSVGGFVVVASPASPPPMTRDADAAPVVADLPPNPEMSAVQLQAAFEAGLGVGAEVEAWWTSSGRTYSVPAVVARINRSSVVVRTARAIGSGGRVLYPAGREIRLPRLNWKTLDRWSWNNRVCPRGGA